MNHYHGYDHEYLNWYRRLNDTTGEAFDPTLFVQLARQQWSNRPQLAAAFARCTAEWSRNELYTYFQAPKHRPERWKFAGSLFLDHPTLGTLVVDVLHDADGPGGYAIGGMEYLDRVLRRRTSAAEMEGIRLHMAAKSAAQRNTN